MRGRTSTDGRSLSCSLLSFQEFVCTALPPASDSHPLVCNKRHLLCLTLMVQAMGSASNGECIQYFHRVLYWQVDLLTSSSPSGGACMPFLPLPIMPQLLSLTYYTLRSVNTENSLRYGFRKLLREVLLVSHITGAAMGAMLLLTTGSSRSGISSCHAARLQPTSRTTFLELLEPLLCLLMFLSPVSSSLSHLPVCLFGVLQACSLVSKTFLLRLS